MIGGFKEASQGDVSTHIILEKDDYNALVSQMKNLEREIDNMKREHAKEYREMEREKSLAIAQSKQEADEKIKEAVAERDRFKNKADSLDNANKNLIRVATERANAKRGLKPKKQHIGYLLLSIKEAYHNYKDTHLRRPEIERLHCWRVRFQTPYDVLIDKEAAERLIYDDLIKKFGAKIGLKNVYGNGYIDDIKTEGIRNLWDSENNFIFKTAYEVNAIKGFWEVEYLTKDFVRVLPEMMIDSVLVKSG